MVSDENILEKGTDASDGDSLPDSSLEEMWIIAENLRTTQELVDAYAGAHDKYWCVADNESDYEEGTEAYKAACIESDAWRQLLGYLEERVIDCAAQQGLFAERQPCSGLVKQLEAFMEKYGYREGSGWWIKNEGSDRRALSYKHGEMLVYNEQDEYFCVGERVSYNGLPYIIKQIVCPSRPESRFSMKIDLDYESPNY